MPSLTGLEVVPQQQSFIQLLDHMMELNSISMVGHDEEDTKPWPSLDYREIPDAWVLREKHFGIHTISGSEPVICISEIAPGQYHIDTTHGQIEVKYVLDVINSNQFNPVHFVGTLNGEEYSCTSSGIPLNKEVLPQELRGLGDMGDLRVSVAEITGEVR